MSSTIFSDQPVADPCNGKLSIRDGARVFFIHVRDIDWIEASGNYVEIHVGAKTYLHRETMNGFLGRLPSHEFARIHRSTVVNLNRIRELRAIERGEYEVIMESGQALETNLSLGRLRELIEGV